MHAHLPSVLVLDTCVLISNVLRRLLLKLAADELFSPAWSRVIGDEWQRNAARLWSVMPVSIAEQWAALQQAFPQADVGETDAFKAGLRYSDAKDWHVIAAARAVQAQRPGAPVGILTRNIKDFNRSELRRLSLTLWEPDQYLSTCMAHHPDALQAALQALPALMVTPEAQALDTLTLLRRDRLFRLAHLFEHAQAEVRA